MDFTVAKWLGASLITVARPSRICTGFPTELVAFLGVPGKLAPVSAANHPSLPNELSIECRADEHRHDEVKNRSGGVGNRHDGGTGAVARKTPTNAEQHRPKHQLRRYRRVAFGKMELVVQNRLSAFQYPGEQQKVGEHRATQHKHELRVPITGEVQKADNLIGVRHARDDEAYAKHESHEERDENLTSVRSNS